LIHHVRKCAARTLKSSMKRRKEPLSLQQCVRCAKNLIQSPTASLLNWQVALYIMISFTGFLRYDDTRYIVASGVAFFDTHVEITLACRKNNHFRGGETVCISRGASVVCPVLLLERWIKLNHLTGDDCIFGKFKHASIFGPVPWSYQEAKQINLGALAASSRCSLKRFTKQFGLHSFRSGGASNAAAEGILDHVFMAHGGWRSQTSMQG